MKNGRLEGFVAKVLEGCNGLTRKLRASLVCATGTGTSVGKMGLVAPVVHMKLTSVHVTRRADTDSIAVTHYIN